jgi:hypothetical protein
MKKLTNLLFTRIKSIAAFIVYFPLIIRILFKVRQNHKQNQKQIAILAPFLYENNAKDGYFQRIRSIDSEVMSDFQRFYLAGSGRRISIKRIDSKHVEIIFNHTSALQNRFVLCLIKHCNLVYCHSIFQAMPDAFSHKLLEKIFLAKIPFFLDLHGIVPEEQTLEQNYHIAKIAEETEQFLIERVDTLIVVTDNMRKHIKKKYHKTLQQTILLPIFPDVVGLSVIEKTPGSNAKNAKPVVVYAGGIQKWQNIKLLQEIIDQTKQYYDYRIFVHDVKAFIESWENRPDLREVRIENISHEQILQEYPQCQYGFILRDHTDVNTVSCPTKLIEYIQNGIIPIMKTPYIGDFYEMGLAYIDYRDFLNNQLPTEEIRCQMAAANAKILQRINIQYQTGVEALQRALQSL